MSGALDPPSDEAKKQRLDQVVTIY